MNHFCSPRQFGRALGGTRALVRTALMAAVMAPSITIASPVEVVVHDPVTGKTVADARVVAYRETRKGELKKIDKANTNGLGVVTLNLPGINRNANYVLKLKWHDRRISSPAVNGIDRYEFVVTEDGTGMQDSRPPRVRIRNLDTRLDTAGFTVQGIALDDSAIASISLIVRDPVLGDTTTSPEFDAESGRWSAQIPANTVSPGEMVAVIAKATDASGKRRSHRLKRRATGVHGDTSIPDIKSPGSGEELSATGFSVTGKIKRPRFLESLTISVEDDMRGVTVDAAPLPLTGRRNFSFEVLPDHVTAGGTATITVQATATSGENLESTIAVKLAEDDTNGEDTAGPSIEISSPMPDMRVPLSGFSIAGRATDDSAVVTLNIAVTNAQGVAIIESTAVELDDDGNFLGEVGPDLLTADQQLTLKITATDGAGNTSVESLGLDVESEDPQPQATVTIDSPAQGSTISATGFALAGRIDSATELVSTSYTLSRADDVLVEDEVLETGADGSFDVTVSGLNLGSEDELFVTVRALDINDVWTTATSSVTVMGDQAGVSANHMLSRITFGATPVLLDDVETIGAMSYLEQQLKPADIDDSALDRFLAGYNPEDLDQLRHYVLVRMVSSRRQLQEVMTQFWDNHFNTYAYASSGDFGNKVEYELAQNNSFREQALGNFGNLLELSAKSPSMLIYLDSVVNDQRNANENYARELMELHTLGVGDSYTQEDVEAAAEIFTGWHLRSDTFWFNDQAHNVDAQTFLGESIPEGGVEQGEQVLRMLATHPATARFLCTKLSALLVSDEPSQSVIDICIDTFVDASAAPDQIAQVVRAIVSSSEFATSGRSKVKTPIEFITSAVRGLMASGDGTSLPWYTAQLHMRPFTMPVPTGYSELGADWMNTDQLVERIKWSHQVGYSPVDDQRIAVDPDEWIARLGLTSADKIVTAMVDVFLGGDITPEERIILMEVLETDEVFDASDPDARIKLRKLIGLVLSLPGFNYQ